ncbi:adhesion G-protein coupled receptor G7 [Salminus brasiliensis]|uniref:adhesion G-protein coupled receptor G7 n=1 Tax=Salminus brasiliensis TaxID=930266 RepID=UPI003B837BC7
MLSLTMVDLRVLLILASATAAITDAVDTTTASLDFTESILIIDQTLNMTIAAPLSATATTAPSMTTGIPTRTTIAASTAAEIPATTTTAPDTSAAMPTAAPTATSNTTTAAPDTSAAMTTAAPTATSNTTTAAPDTSAAMTTAAPTATSNTTTAAPDTSAAMTTAAPTATSNTTTAAPDTSAAMTTAAPNTTTAAPTAAPDTTTAAPDTTTAAPDTTTAAPDTTTAAPTAAPDTTTATPTAAPNTTTAVPDTTTDIPAMTTAAPDTTTAAPDTTTAGPNTTTDIPAMTTAAPDTTTAAPDTTTTTPTAAPNTTTAVPDTTTDIPAMTTAAPDTTTAAPDTTTAAPNTTTAGPNTTTDIPAMTTAAPDTTTAAPDTTTAAPNTTTAAPDTTTAGPNTTTDIPAMTTAAPDTTTAAPTAAPNTTTAASDTTTAASDTTTAASDTTTAAPTAAPNTTTATSTAAPSTTVATTRPPTDALSCQNGGRPENGVCICPDDYTGRFCELPGLPQATARCLNGLFSFDKPQVLNCSLTLDTIYGDLSHASLESRQSLAFNTQILTSNPQKLTTQNISTAAQIASNLLSSGPISEDIKLAAVTTVSQLLNSSVAQFSTQTANSISSLTRTLQNFSLNLNSTEPQLVQPNLVVQVTTIKPTEQVHFSAFKGLTDTFTSDRINVNQSSIPSQNATPPIDVQMSIKLTGDSSQKDSDAHVNVGFVLYNNDQFFRSKVFKDPLGSKRRVISGNLQGQGKLNVNIEFTIGKQNVSDVTLHDFACVFWDYNQEDWSTKGCIKVLKPSAGLNSSVLTCSCNHATNFAVLMSFSPNYKYSPALDAISITGCALSIAGLVLTLLFQILTRKTRGTSPTLLMVSICVAMIAFYLLFIFGINNPVQQSGPSPPSDANTIPASSVHLAPEHGTCTAIAALLQYFLLATFTWSTLYAAHIYLMIRNTILGPPKNFIVYSIAAGWGLPAVIVGISLGATYRPDAPLNYRQEEFCWLAVLDDHGKFDPKKPMLWGFLLPLAAMIFFNIAVLFYFACTTCRTNTMLNSSQVTPLWKKMLSSLSLAVVLGVSWIVGYFMLLSNQQITQNILTYVFCLCNTTQGLQIFMLFTVRTKYFKEKFNVLRKSVSTPELSFHRLSYNLWSMKRKDPCERYRSTVFDNND